MSKKLADSFQPKITRNDRFAQMSHQEKIIEQKKKEILAKLEAKHKANAEGKASNAKVKSLVAKKEEPKKQLNVFSNDGSFLDKFKQLKDKRVDSKIKSFKLKDNQGDDHNRNRWIQKRGNVPNKNRKTRISRFDKPPSFEPKITINTTFNNNLNAPPYDVQLSIASQNVTGQPLLKNLIGPPTNHYPPTVTQTNETVITSPPVLINMPPPQMVQGSIVLPSTQQTVLVQATPSVPIQSNSTLITTVALPPPNLITTPVSQPALPSNNLTVIPAVELASIPPPNAIQVQNIPQPEPLNTLNIPHPAPIQVQNIPTPNPIILNEIPNPKPLDLLNIPTPNDDKNISDHDFIKNVPPPNKSVPPPPLTEVSQTIVQSTILPPTILSSQNVIVNNIPPQQMQHLQAQNTFNTISVTVPVGVVQPPTSDGMVTNIPSLMAQPILPPPGMNVANVNVNCPPPLLSIQQTTDAVFNNPTASLTNQMPPMNVPPPNTNLQLMNQNRMVQQGFKDMNAVFPPGTPDYEAMASLGRMVAQCGQGIEDVVRQRKTQDPSLWFLFHKESAAYHQYQQLIEQFKQTNANECDILANDPNCNEVMKGDETSLDWLPSKRKRKSRWGDQEMHVQSPIMMGVPPQPIRTKGPVMISKVTRSDPALVQYAINTFGTTNLSDEEWKKAEDHYKINLLYQDMVKKREELEKLRLQGKNKYDYDSDEETDGGTWEHKLREKEMMATQLWAQELNRQAEGKHHIGDFLPPDELKRFMEKSNATKEGRQPNFSDYKEFKIKEDNIGFKMLQKLGWTEGTGLGQGGSGIVEPINKAAPRDQNQGLGLMQMSEGDDDEYESYRKRMMLAYRFRPNPLNNPRRPYY